MIDNSAPVALLYYNTIYSSNKDNQCACHCQSLSSQSNICEKSKEPTLRQDMEWLHSSRLQLCSQLLDYGVSEKRTSLLQLPRERLCGIGTSVSVACSIKKFKIVINYVP